MSPIVAGVVGLGVLFVLMFAGLPIGFAMLLVGSVGFVYIVRPLHNSLSPHFPLSRYVFMTYSVQ